MTRVYALRGRNGSIQAFSRILNLGVQAKLGPRVVNKNLAGRVGSRKWTHAGQVRNQRAQLA
jgi:hypothetical protein